MSAPFGKLETKGDEEPVNAVPEWIPAELFLEISDNLLSPRAGREELRENVLGETMRAAQEVFPRTDSSPCQSLIMASFELLSAFTPLGVTR